MWIILIRIKLVLIRTQFDADQFDPDQLDPYMYQVDPDRVCECGLIKRRIKVDVTSFLYNVDEFIQRRINVDSTSF